MWHHWSGGVSSIPVVALVTVRLLIAATPVADGTAARAEDICKECDSTAIRTWFNIKTSVDEEVLEAGFVGEIRRALARWPLPTTGKNV